MWQIKYTVNYLLFNKTFYCNIINDADLAQKCREQKVQDQDQEQEQDLDHTLLISGSKLISRYPTLEHGYKHMFEDFGQNSFQQVYLNCGEYFKVENKKYPHSNKPGKFE